MIEPSLTDEPQSIEPITIKPNISRANPNQLFFKAQKNEEANCYDLNKPTIGMIIVAACIPVIGWAYLAYLLFDAIYDWYIDNSEQQPLMDI